LSKALEISNVEAGLQTVGWLKPGLHARRVAAAAALRNVEVVPLDVYASGRSRREGLVLGFAAVDPRELRRGVEELGKVLSVG
jgi:GntR family transcriptional regulator/MocR family aminotransferase